MLGSNKNRVAPPMGTSHKSRVTPAQVMPSSKGTVSQGLNPVVVNSQSYSNRWTMSRAHPGTPQRTRKEMMPETGPETRLQYLRSKEDSTPERALQLTCKKASWHGWLGTCFIQKIPSCGLGVTLTAFLSIGNLDVGHPFLEDKIIQLHGCGQRVPKYSRPYKGLQQR